MGGYRGGHTCQNHELWARETCISFYLNYRLKGVGGIKGKTNAQARRKRCSPGGQLGRRKGCPTPATPFLRWVSGKEVRSPGNRRARAPAARTVRAAAAGRSPRARTRGGRGPSCFGRALPRAGRGRGRNWGGAGRSAAERGGARRRAAERGGGRRGGRGT